MALLKELIAHNLVEPSWVSINERNPNHFQLQIKCNHNKVAIDKYAREKKLTIEDDSEQTFLVISKP